MRLIHFSHAYGANSPLSKAILLLKVIIVYSTQSMVAFDVVARLLLLQFLKDGMKIIQRQQKLAIPDGMGSFLTKTTQIFEQIKGKGISINYRYMSD